MKLIATAIAGVHVVEPDRRADERGWFMRIFCENELAPVLGDQRIVQANNSLTRTKGAVRGMHFQHAPHAETKLVRCIRGRAWDVALDLRKGSPTFLHWYAQELDPEGGRMLVIPRGCAHGFQALEADTELLYFATAAYAPQSESGINALDIRAAIAWPLPLTQRSERDAGFAPLGGNFEGIEA